MNKNELISAIAAKANCPATEANKVLDAFTAVVTEALVNGDKIALAGFGTFEVKEKAERAGCNPKTGEKITIAACKAPAFKAGKALKDAVNN